MIQPFMIFACLSSEKEQAVNTYSQIATYQDNNGNTDIGVFN